MPGVDAGRELCRLLADTSLPYRAMWEERGLAYAGRELNQSAVARVVAAYLVDRGMLAEFEEGDWPRSRRDWVRSRLAGSTLTHLELELFMDAFVMADQHRDHLRQHLESARTPRPREMFEPGQLRLSGLPDRSAYEIVEVCDRHVVGPDTRPVEHHTQQRIRARTDGVAAYVCIVDETTATLEVRSGGTAREPLEVGQNLAAIVIDLDRTLDEGEEWELVFTTTFAYPEPPTPCVRRAAASGRALMRMEVVFDPQRLPSEVELSTWASLVDTDPTTSSPVELDDQHTVSASWTTARAGLVGFSWMW